MKSQPQQLDAQESEYLSQIKGFIASDAWTKYALPMIYQAVQKELPAPNTKGWEDKYRYAFALSSALNMIVNTLTNVAGRDEFIKQAERFMDGEVPYDAPVDEA